MPTTLAWRPLKPCTICLATFGLEYYPGRRAHAFSCVYFFVTRVASGAMSGSIAAEEPRANYCRTILSPFVQLSQLREASQPATAPQSQPKAGSDLASAAWTPYHLPETRAILAIHQAAALRLRQAGTAAPTSDLRAAVPPRTAALQAPLSKHQLAFNAVGDACADCLIGSPIAL